MRLDFSEHDEEQNEESAFLHNEEANSDRDESFDDDFMSDEELERRLRARKERYRDPDYVRPEKDTRTINKWIPITVICVVFAYFIVLIVLNMTGTITSLMLFLLSLPLGIAGLIVYLIYNKKHPGDRNIFG